METESGDDDLVMLENGNVDDSKSLKRKSEINDTIPDKKVKVQ